MTNVVNEVAELIRYRELIRNLVLRDIKVRYKRSVLGFVWVMLHPFLMMLVLSVVFSALFKSSTKNYTVYLLSGIIMWNFFSQSTTATVSSFLANSNIIKKIYLPKSIFPLSMLLSALVNFVFSLVPLTAILLFTHTSLGPHCYLLPFVLIMLFVFSFGLSMLLSIMTVFFHDVIYIYEVLLYAWMYATPVFYPESIIPEKFRIVLSLNPLYYFMKLFRGWLYMDLSVLSPDVFYGAAFALASLVVGWGVYLAYKDRIIYYL